MPNLRRNHSCVVTVEFMWLAQFARGLAKKQTYLSQSSWASLCAESSWSAVDVSPELNISSIKKPSTALGPE